MNEEVKQWRIWWEWPEFHHLPDKDKRRWVGSTGGDTSASGRTLEQALREFHRFVVLGDVVITKVELHVERKRKWWWR